MARKSRVAGNVIDIVPVKNGVFITEENHDAGSRIYGALQ